MTRDIRQTVDSHLCTGCGGCAGMFPKSFKMMEDTTAGLRPVAVGTPPKHALDLCAGSGVDYRELELTTQAEQDWGPIEATYIGHAADPELRHKGSSGGAISAIAAYALEKGLVSGILHIGSAHNDALSNTARISTNRKALLEAAGSRYAQASPLDGLRELDGTPGTYGFIGKPCDVASLAKIKKAFPDYKDKLPLTISLLCAGPSNRVGVNELVNEMGVEDRAVVASLRYRGEGWPGTMQATYTDKDGNQKRSAELSYENGWGQVLQKHRLWPCRICIDHVGFFADISVGDPWHLAPEGNSEKGESLIVSRTPYGQSVIEGAIREGYLEAQQVNNNALEKAQPNLLNARASAFGRRLTMRLMGLPVPADRGTGLLRCWLRTLSPREKLSSILGTAKRIISQKIYRAPKIISAGDELK